MTKRMLAGGRDKEGPTSPEKEMHASAKGKVEGCRRRGRVTFSIRRRTVNNLSLFPPIPFTCHFSGRPCLECARSQLDTPPVNSPDRRLPGVLQILLSMILPDARRASRIASLCIARCISAARKFSLIPRGFSREPHHRVYKIAARHFSNR